MISSLRLAFGNGEVNSAVWRTLLVEAGKPRVVVERLERRREADDPPERRERLRERVARVAADDAEEFVPLPALVKGDECVARLGERREDAVDAVNEGQHGIPGADHRGRGEVACHQALGRRAEPLDHPRCRGDARRVAGGRGDRRDQRHGLAGECAGVVDELG